jgi:hypothetical protein
MVPKQTETIFFSTSKKEKKRKEKKRKEKKTLSSFSH